jgi:uncharacterized damage-inducible protein DinB
MSVRAIHAPDRGHAGLPAVTLAGMLGEIATLIESLGDEQYVDRRPAFGATLGGHVRHTLDHVEAFLRGLASGQVEYDRRERGTAVESSRTAALELIESLSWRLLHVRTRLGDPIGVTLVDPAAGEVRLMSTVGRELASLESHTVHHQALMAAIARSIGAAAPEDFGVAHSTRVHRRQLACAR